MGRGGRRDRGTLTGRSRSVGSLKGEGTERAEGRKGGRIAGRERHAPSRSAPMTLSVPSSNLPSFRPSCAISPHRPRASGEDVRVTRTSRRESEEDVRVTQTSRRESEEDVRVTRTSCRASRGILWDARGAPRASHGALRASGCERWFTRPRGGGDGSRCRGRPWSGRGVGSRTDGAGRKGLAPGRGSACLLGSSPRDAHAMCRSRGATCVIVNGLVRT